VAELEHAPPSVVPDVGAAPGDRSSRTVLVLRVAGFGALATLTLLALGSALARVSFVGEVCASFRWQTGWTGVGIAAALALLRLRLPAILAALASLYLLAPGLGVVFGRSDSEETATVAGLAGGSTNTLRVVTANMLFTNDLDAELLDWIASESPDVLAIQELPRDWMVRLADLHAAYPSSLTYPSDEKGWTEVGFGIGLFTRLPVTDKRVRVLRPDQLPVLELEVRVGKWGMTVRTLHPPSPQDAELWAARNEFLELAARELPWHSRCVVLGDLNTSSGSPAFDDLLERSGLRDTRRGFGRLPTWRTSEPIAGLWTDLDHILVGAWVAVVERGTSTIPGSDHLAATATLSVLP
jgi:endonuclease/exonuclease/phosphatase (EEP) superfamily protein YafD